MLSILYLIISQMQQSLFIYDCFCLFDYFPSARIVFLSSGIFSEPHKPKVHLLGIQSIRIENFLNTPLRACRQNRNLLYLQQFY